MNYSGISECDVLNGSGFRVVLFVSGCSHHCDRCQNPETHDENFGHKFTEFTLQYILNCLSKDYIDGITLSGGDPMYENNLTGMLNILKKIREVFPNKSIWIYTGYTFEELQKLSGLRMEVLSYCDVLIDGRYVDNKRNLNLYWRNSSNQRVIDVQKTLKTGKVVLLNV